VLFGNFRTFQLMLLPRLLGTQRLTNYDPHGVKTQEINIFMRHTVKISDHLT